MGCFFILVKLVVITVHFLDATRLCGFLAFLSCGTVKLLHKSGTGCVGWWDLVMNFFVGSRVAFTGL